MSEEDRVAFETELKRSVSLQNEVEELRFLLNAMDNIKELHQVDTVSHWQEMSRKVYYDKLKYKAATSFKRFSVFALLPLLLLISYLGLNLLKSAHYGEEIIEAQSAYGVVSKIMLPDSSFVFLNSGSQIAYPRSFTQDTRKVTLKGEAYFIVKACPEKRFEVQTSDGFTVSAYGTKFNVNAYEDQEWVNTVLVNGNISVRVDGNSEGNKIVQPGELVVYNKLTGKIDISKSNLAVETAWIDGKIVFRRTKMPEIIYRLSKHFNVDIELDDKALNQYEFSATFTTESLTEILNLMMKASPMTWHYVEPVQLHDKTYTKRKVVISLL